MQDDKLTTEESLKLENLQLRGVIASNALDAFMSMLRVKYGLKENDRVSANGVITRAQLPAAVPKEAAK